MLTKSLKDVVGHVTAVPRPNLPHAIAEGSSLRSGEGCMFGMQAARVAGEQGAKQFFTLLSMLCSLRFRCHLHIAQ